MKAAVIPPFPFPPDFSLHDLLPTETVVVRSSRSQNALCLNAGGIVEYAWAARRFLGVDARYLHAFFDRGLNLRRVTARARWQS